MTLSRNCHSYCLPLEIAAAVKLLTPPTPYKNHVIGGGKSGLENEKRGLPSQLKPRTDNAFCKRK